ncbi:MAG: FKBP-type peptidyl-prolyl cis-trans isomerase [Gemmatimonadales bacterium]
MTVTESGVRYFDIAEGAGAVAAPGHSVRVRYQGWLTDGTSFDGGVYPPPGGRPLILGTRSVIQGWDDGIPGMKVGGRRQLVIPPELGYGAGGAGNVIPPNATLVFEVELLETGN